MPLRSPRPNAPGMFRRSEIAEEVSGSQNLPPRSRSGCLKKESHSSRANRTRQRRPAHPLRPSQTDPPLRFFGPAAFGDRRMSASALFERHDLAIEDQFVLKFPACSASSLKLIRHPAQISGEYFHASLPPMKLSANAVELVFHDKRLTVESPSVGRDAADKARPDRFCRRFRAREHAFDRTEQAKAQLVAICLLKRAARFRRCRREACSLPSLLRSGASKVAAIASSTSPSRKPIRKSPVRILTRYWPSRAETVASAIGEVQPWSTDRGFGGAIQKILVIGAE